MPTRRPRVALIAMPWVSARMPSIQLAVLRRCLAGAADVDTHELYVDYAASITSGLYERLADSGGMVEEWLFAKAYFEAEGVPMPSGFLDDLPPLDVGTPEFERKLVETLVPVTADFLDRVAAEIDWSSYDVVGFTLTAYQTAPSLALARLIRRRSPRPRIVFGGFSCAGSAARALLEMSPYVDVIVRGEAEPVLVQLVERLRDGRALEDVPGITFRSEGGIIETPNGPPYDFARTGSANARAPLEFDAFLERRRRLGLAIEGQVVLPFESSRGCWWGERARCTFCGLHDTARFRPRDATDVLAELDQLYARHGVSRFKAVDLIMPLGYYDTLLPALAESDRKYEIFYELKGNVTRRRMALLAQAGVSWTQPGLESLNSSTLRRMGKGISAVQNVQFLKWAAEYGIHTSWNIIAGMPGEAADEIERAAALVPSLFHLSPPNFVYFELNRYSPVFEKPERYGLTNLRPLDYYRRIYPVPEHVLRGYAYRWEYDSAEFAGTPPWLEASNVTYAAMLRDAVASWHEARGRGASLILRRCPEGADIIDTRFSAEPRRFRLSGARLVLYDYLDSRRSMERIADEFARAAPRHAQALGGERAIDAQISLWLEDRLVLEEDGQVVALAVEQPPNAGCAGKRDQPAVEPASAMANGGMIDVASVAALLRRAGLERMVVTRVEPVPGIQSAGLAYLDDGVVLFVKRITEGRDDAHVYDGLDSGLLPEALSRLLPRRILSNLAAGFVVHEGLASHANWARLLETSEGYALELAAKVARLMARLHDIEPPPEGSGVRVSPKASARELPFRAYHRVTPRELADAPGFHYREFLRAVQGVAPQLDALRRSWAETCFIHGDLKADNVLVSPDGSDVRFVDWEFARAGDPLFDVGTAVGSVLMMWLHLVQPDGAQIDHWVGRAPVSALAVGRCIRTLVQEYSAAAGIDDTILARRRIASFAGAFLMERGYVANWGNGRWNVGVKLCVELGARILTAPESLFDSFSPPEVLAS